MSLITISESIGCEGMSIAKLVADALNLELFDDRRLEQEALEIGIRPDDLKGIDEKAPGLFSRILSNKPQVYLDLLQSVVFEVAKEGNGVIFGHGSQVLLRDFGCALHVGIYASESFRLQHVMNGQKLSREAAEKLIRKRDSERKGFFQYAFHRDYNDPSLYDLVIQRDKIGTDLATRLITEAARSDEMKECSLTALDSMDRLALTRRVEAAVTEHELTGTLIHPDILHIEVPEKGVVHISGATQTMDAEALLRKVIKAVPGVKEIQCEIAVVTQMEE